MNPSNVVAVDLTPLRGDGSNGGAKHVILEFLDYIQKERASEFRFLYLCNSTTQHEVRNFCRDEDITFCVLKLDGVEPLPPHLMTANDYQCFEDQEQHQLLCKENIGLVYAPFGNTDYSRPGVPTIIMIHDLLHRDFPHSLPAEEIQHRETFFSNMLSLAECIQVNSEYTKSRLVDCYEVPADQIFVTHLPVHSRLKRTGEPFSGQNDTVDPFFLYPSNFWVHKNHEILVVAYQKYLHELGDKAWRLVFTGHEDDRKNEIRSLVRNLGLEHKVEFLGYVSDDELTSYWSGAQALVFPSLHEGFGIPILEAMHFQLPIIAHNGTSLPEVAGDAAHFCDCRNPFSLSEAMIEVSTKANYRQVLIEAGRKRLNQFNLDQEAETLATRLHDTLAAGTSRLSQSGISQDGWIGKSCILSTPKDLGRTTVEIECFPFPEARILSIHIGDYPFGSFELEMGEEYAIRFVADIEGQNIKIESNEVSRIRSEDPRYFGVRLKSVSLSSELSHPTILWSTP